MSSIPSPSVSQSLRPITKKRLLAAHERLVASQLYLGDHAIRDRVEWLRDGKCNRLVVKPEVTAERIEQNVAEPPSPSGDDDEVPPFELACLAMAGTISDADYYLTSDANWRPMSFSPDFSCARPTGSIGATEHEPFAADHKEVMENLHWLQSVVATPGFTSSKGLFVGPDNDPRVKFRHMLFEAREDVSSDAAGSQSDDKSTGASSSSTQVANATSRGDATDNDGTDSEKENSELTQSQATAQSDNEEDAPGTQFLTKNWPCYSEITQAALQDIIKTHRVVPIPAYDMHGDLIQPRMYRSRLMGATVSLKFTLTHWSIGKGRQDTANREKTDVYVADLHHIRVLVPPKPSPVTPRKRKIAAVDSDPSNSPSPSPAKRQRIEDVTEHGSPTPMKKKLRSGFRGM